MRCVIRVAILCMLAATICAAADKWASKAKDLTAENFSKALPTVAPSFVLFYSQMCEHCKNKSLAFDQVIELFAANHDRMHFYRIDGPENPVLIKDSFPQISYYPAAAYFEPNSGNITELYTAESWLPRDIKLWMDKQLAAAASKKSVEPHKEEAKAAPVVPFDPKLCEGYDKANKLCDGYDKVTREVAELKNRISEMRAKMTQLVQLNEKREEREVRQQRARDVEAAAAAASGQDEDKGSWTSGVLLFLGGGAVGFLVCFAVFSKLNPKKSRTSV